MADVFDFYVKDNRTIQFNLTEPIMLEDSHVSDWVFHIPRVLNNIDMSGWAWWLVYINARGQKYSELLELSEDPESPLEKCIATYSVDYGMSIKAGTVRFSLEAINTDTGGEILNEWHTQTYQAKVQDTLQGNQVEFTETESDIISALIVEVQNKVAQLVGGATPLPVNLKSLMADHDKVYLYTGSEPNESTGYWYYYNGSNFVPGGQYGAGITDAVPTAGSTNAVQSGGVKSALDGLQAEIPTVDAVPTQGSTNAVSSGGVYSALAGKVDVETGNIFSIAELLSDSGYVAINGNTNKTVIQSNSAYSAYLLPVDGMSIYSFTNCRFAFLVDSDGETVIGSLLEYVTQVNSAGASYIAFSFNHNDYPISAYVVSEGTALNTDVKLPNIEPLPTMQTDIENLKSGVSDLSERFDEFEYNSGVNLFGKSELLSGSGYGNIVDGDLAIINNASYSCYLLPVDGESVYTFQICRFAFLVGPDKTSAIGSLLENVNQITATGASYICFSFNHNDYPVSDYWVYGAITTAQKPKFASISGSLASGGNLQITACRNDLRKGERVVFEGDITSFGSLKIGQSFSQNVGTETNQKNTFLIDGTNISYYFENTSTPVVVAHGLTITANIQIIWEMTDTASCKFTLISDGVLFEHEFTNFVKKTIGNPYVLSISTVMTNCKLTWTCVDLVKNIWMFGDSYFSYSTTRWSYYLHEYGYDKNCLLNGYAGENQVNAVRSIGNLLYFGSPKYAVWCIGMNDGSDASSAPSESWVAGRDAFLTHCEINVITPIFGTIPTVPSINHEQKNAWIRSSGYRYIDFAKAVGAQSDGTWFSGMLSSDNVHPTEQGAKALFARVLLDLPEIMIDDFGR